MQTPQMTADLLEAAAGRQHLTVVPSVGTCDVECLEEANIRVQRSVRCAELACPRLVHHPPFDAVHREEHGRNSFL
jgi:hypothetical protein